MQRVLIIFIFTGLAFSCNFSEGETEQKPKAKYDPLSGLHELKKTFDKDRSFVLNDTSNIYDKKGQRLTEKETLKRLMSGDYIAVPYADDKNNIMAYVVRAAEQGEKKDMRNAEQEGEIHRWKGKKISSLDFRDIQGQDWTMEDLKDKIIVFNFWFIECKPCLMEIPKLNELVADYKDNENVVFLAFAENEKDQLKNFLGAQSFDYNIVPNAENFSQKFNVESFPSHMVVGKKGKVQYTYKGYGPNTIAKMRKKINQMIG